MKNTSTPHLNPLPSEGRGQTCGPARLEYKINSDARRQDSLFPRGGEGQGEGATGSFFGSLVVVVILIALQSNAQNLPPIERPLVAVTNPPPIQMLVPGFTVRELPLELNNINNLVYAPDGRLFALGYDGNVWQLKDTDGDGLEDQATKFFDNAKNEILPSIGAAWGPSPERAEAWPTGTESPDSDVRSWIERQPRPARQAGGLYIASQGRVIFLRDKGDGTSELRTVTAGWVKPTGIAGSNLDAIGLAVNKAGEVFFGLGCDKWYEAYKINTNTLKSEYDIRSERGTILKISRDGKAREIIATGLRFPVGMAFNANGDLFCTDQEGATWLPNGNPFDELLHIQRGRHYGFPPRHPKYLPNVIDEPSLFDYAPQHQSTCGIHFNEPVGKSGKTFGPVWWRGDAFVAGESRGKIFRTKLVKTTAGYVVKTDLIACLSMLTLDAAPTPGGDLIVACHSGKPDWGTGPQGKGKLFKISYSDPTAPQPVLAYAVSSTEARVVFDRVLTGKELAAFAGQCAVAVGKYVTAGERFETFRPGYQVVNIQRTMPRFELPVVEARAGADKQSLVLRTAAHVQAVNYAITLPTPKTSEAATIDLLADLSGAEAVWKSSGGNDEWSGWLPHLDLSAARGFTAASDEHTRLFKLLAKRGTLVLRAQLDLWNMLRPATQPESKLDFTYPSETVTVVFKANSKLDLKSDGRIIRVSAKEVRVTADSKENQWLPIELNLATAGGEPRLDVSWFTAEDSRERPLPLRRILLPWAKPYVAVALAKRVPELEGGDWERGKKIFFSEQPGCFKCHSIHNEGGTIGADLSNLLYRDYVSVLRDITEPSAAINPEHIAYNVELKNGEAHTGVVLENDAEKVVLGLVDGTKMTIPKGNVSTMKASSVSLMPEGLLKGLTAEQQRDLLTFLLLAEPKSGQK